MIRPIAAAAFCLLAIASCQGDPGSAPAPVFGERESVCGVTVLTNDVEDELLLREGVDCLLDAVDARQPVVWDLLLPTVEGDPILYRFEGDGRQVTILEDATRDAFGRRNAVLRQCDSIEDTGFVPVGAGCSAESGVSFTLPEGIWPP